MKEILITNDDGFEARGMLELAKALKKNRKCYNRSSKLGKIGLFALFDTDKTA